MGLSPNASCQRTRVCPRWRSWGGFGNERRPRLRTSAILRRVIARQGLGRHVGLAVAVAIVLVGCSPSTPTPPASLSSTPPASASSGPSVEPSSSLPPSQAPTPSPIPTPVLVPSPLTGELVSPAAAKQHPIAVMIDDLSPARPQSGLSYASIIFQAPAEGGIPRYM